MKPRDLERYLRHPVMASWLREQGCRLDAPPFLSGAVEARKLVEALPVRKDPLSKVTLGVFHAGRESRKWVQDPAFGVPFLGSTDILAADLSRLPLLSRNQVEANPNFTIREGWTLITRSGTIGRMAYARPEMDGMACSEHVLRVAPDPDRIPPGYLYAFLSSKFGQALVASGTYGAIIQHIEPDHISNVAVPRLDEELEARVHELVRDAARARTEARHSIDHTEVMLKEELDLPELRQQSVTQFGTSTVMSSKLNHRIDAPYHSPAAQEADAALDHSRHRPQLLSRVSKRLFKPPIFKRLWVDGPEHGPMFISGQDAYRVKPEAPRYVSRGTPKFDEFILEKGWVVFQAAGQIYGLFGQPLLVSGWLEGIFCADDMYRIVPHDEIDGAFIYCFLRTPHGQVLLKRQACGNSIPRVWDPQMSEFKIPWPDRPLRERIAQPILTAHTLYAQAYNWENQAVQLVERAIEGLA